MDLNQDTKPFNLTQLRKNSHAGTEQESGRKRQNLDVHLHLIQSKFCNV